MEDEFDGKVFVIDNQRISVTQRQAVLDAKLMADEGIAVEEIVKYLMDTKMEATIYIMVDTLKYLKKGGRDNTGGSGTRHDSETKAGIADSG